MSYREAIASIQPEFAVQMSFAEKTGKNISSRVAQHLINEYGAELVLDATSRMTRKPLANPVSYLTAVCKNIRAQKVSAPKDLSEVVTRFLADQRDANRPELRSPFDGVTSQ